MKIKREIIIGALFLASFYIGYIIGRDVESNRSSIKQEKQTSALIDR